ncbi:MAG: guanylate kinase [Proteobacteria bacterium]|nr:guanylate kinase [Pseudomonadota bacterium]
MTKRRGRRGVPFVIAAPSGTGKSTLCHRLLADDRGLRFSISHTTRAPRSGERDGVDYHFVSAERFRELVDAGEFLEHAEYSGQLYGTSSGALDALLDEGFDVLVEVEVQGARQIREARPDARFVFLLPPDLAELERRLKGRGTDSPEAVQRRLAVADRELAAAEIFDYAVVNRDLEAAVAAVREIVEAERQGRRLPEHERARVLAAWHAAKARVGPARTPPVESPTD